METKKQVKQPVKTQPLPNLLVVALDDKEMSVVSGGGVVMGD